MKKYWSFKKTKNYNLLIVALLISFMLNSNTINAQDNEGSKVKWISLTEAMEKVKKEPRPIILDFYTDWCGWCKQMMKTTYADDNIANYINTYFYAAKFNAETKDTIEYLGKKYKSTSDQPKAAHELAVKFLGEKLMYPTTLFLNGFDKEKNAFAINLLAAGYLDAIKIQPILVYTLENVFRNATVDDFTTEFTKAFTDTSINRKVEEFKWQKPVVAFADSTKKKNKSLVFINTNWCNSCKVMKRASFTDSLNSNYLTKTFNCIDFDAEIMDTINFKGKYFINPHTVQQNLHQLCFELVKNNFAIPSVVILDEQMNYIDAIPGYQSPKLLNEISHFYGDDIYKTKPWQEFYKEAEETFNKLKIKN